MDRRSWLRIILVCISAASVDSVRCAKKYEDETVKIFNCSECCGGEYTRYCCLPPPVQEDESSSEFTPSVIAVIIICVVIVIALVIGIAVCAAWYFCDCFGTDSPLAPYKHQPSSVVVPNGENNENLGYNDDEFDEISENGGNFSL